MFVQRPLSRRFPSTSRIGNSVWRFCLLATTTVGKHQAGRSQAPIGGRSFQENFRFSTLLWIDPDLRSWPPVGARCSLELDHELTEALKAFSRREGVTLFTTLLAVFNTLLFRYTGQEDLLVGTPVAGRTTVELEGLIGPVLRTLVLRNDVSGNSTFRELLGRIRETTLEAMSRQDLPFEKLLETLQPDRALSHSPIFQVLFNFRNVPTSSSA